MIVAAPGGGPEGIPLLGTWPYAWGVCELVVDIGYEVNG